MAEVEGGRLAPDSPVTVSLVKPRGDNVEYPAVALVDDGNHVYVRFEPGDVFTEHYWRDRWYSIKEVRAGGGELKGWYCDVARPASVRDGLVISEDLDLDLWASADGRTILRHDEDDFAGSGLGDRDPAAAAQARQALDELERLARDRFSAISR